jgi:hypothetical protein
MKNIIYFNKDDAEKFDYDRFKKSLNDYAKVPDADIKAALKTLDQYENLHVSRLVETGALLIAKDGTESAAKKYYDAHDQYFGDKFERLRRITGYLVGSLERWNDGKKAEEAARVKHNVSVGQYDLKTKCAREAKKASAKKAVGKA